MDFKLCDQCAEDMDQCQWCLAPLSGSSTATHTATSGIPYITVVDNDNGRTFKALNVGDQVHIELEEDTWSGKEWEIKGCGAGLSRQIGSQFTADPNDYQYGTRKFIIDVRQAASGTTGDIELHEVQRSHGYGYWGYQQQSGPVPNSKQFKVSINVK
jgi:hypothetical protein